MAQRILNNGDTNATIRTNINSNFSELYPEKHTHTNADSLARITGTTAPLWNGAAWPGGGGTADLPFVYHCTGTDDDLAIQNIINDFFANGTAMSMLLIVSGRMGLQAAPVNNRHIAITAANTRGAVCHVDFSDCDIPEITAASRNFLYITSNAVRINIVGLFIKTTQYGVYLTGGSNNNSFTSCTITGENGVYLPNSNNNSLTNCTIIGNTYGVYVSNSNNNSLTNCTITGNNGVYLHSTLNGIITLSDCKIIGAAIGINVATANTAAEIKLINNLIKGTSTQDIQQTTAASTVKWYITGNSFSRASVIVDGTTAISYKTASSSIYFPQYANQFSRTIE